MQSSLGRGEKWRQRLWLCLIYMQVASPKNCCLTVHVFRLCVCVCVCVCRKCYVARTMKRKRHQAVNSSVQLSSTQAKAVHLHLYGLLTMLTLMYVTANTHTHTQSPPKNSLRVSESHCLFDWLSVWLSVWMSECLSLCLFALSFAFASW